MSTTRLYQDHAQARRHTLLFLSAVASPGAPASDSPALQVFKQWLEAFNSGDAARTSAFWRKYGNAGDDRSADDLHLREMTGGMTISKVEEDTGTHLVVLMKEGRGTYSESTLELATTNPPVVARIGGHPVPTPQSVGHPASSDEDLAKKVREHVAETDGADAFSGAVLIAHNGKVVLDQAWGMADRTRQIKNTTDTQFCLGSMNKMFTSIAILQLVGREARAR